MGLLDRLRGMFGGSNAEKPRTDEVEEEVAVERVQHDLERDRNKAVERRLETPTSLDD